MAGNVSSNSTETDNFDDMIQPIVTICFSLIGITGFIGMHNICTLTNTQYQIIYTHKLFMFWIKWKKIFSFTGNTLVIFVVLLNPQMRSTTNMLIINLAIADLLFVIFCVPFTAIDYVSDTWPLGNIWCKIIQYLIIVTALASIYTLVLMSLDRFLAVVYPISSRSLRNERNAFTAITILWLIILSASIPVIFAHGVVVSRSTTTNRTTKREQIPFFSFILLAFPHNNNNKKTKNNQNNAKNMKRKPLNIHSS